MEDSFVFRRISIDEPMAETLHRAAIEKLQTLYPLKHINTYDMQTIGIETDSLYSETGIDTYELGFVDEDIPAIRNTRSDEVITFRV